MRDFKIRKDGLVKGTTGFRAPRPRKEKKRWPGARKIWNCSQEVTGRPVIPLPIKNLGYLLGFLNAGEFVCVAVQCTLLFICPSE